MQMDNGSRLWWTNTLEELQAFDFSFCSHQWTNWLMAACRCERDSNIRHAGDTIPFHPGKTAKTTNFKKKIKRKIWSALIHAYQWNSCSAKNPSYIYRYLYMCVYKYVYIYINIYININIIYSCNNTIQLLSFCLFLPHVVCWYTLCVWSASVHHLTSPYINICAHTQPHIFSHYFCPCCYLTTIQNVGNERGRNFILCSFFFFNAMIYREWPQLIYP